MPGKMDINNELTWLLIVHYLILQSRFFIQTPVPFCTEVGVHHALVGLSRPGTKVICAYRTKQFYR